MIARRYDKLTRVVYGIGVFPPVDHGGSCMWIHNGSEVIAIKKVSAAKRVTSL